MTWIRGISPRHTCPRPARALAAYIETLRTCRILHEDIDFPAHKFCYLLEAAVNLPRIFMTEFECKNPYTSPRKICDCCSNLQLERNLSREVSDEAKKIIEKRRIFNCLDCLKSDGSSAKEKTCRMPHFS
ncbi:hypothetical protein LX32DRAFT_316336 [Colletotrichum zoysiae]|uniref:Uncharacterized protein n=1 Tax=Colletotrichum zoysiae TaxID=1216348 RepID=A0AAD9HK42_9PEZI|nr:hypothetical protein LX32DRAFT_316336 [Colletotrichum zoysiae]